jgi:hypothetical protein
MVGTKRGARALEETTEIEYVGFKTKSKYTLNNLPPGVNVTDIKFIDRPTDTVDTYV